MKRMFKLFVLILSLILVGGLKGGTLNVEERLSLTFSEIAITNGHFILLRVKKFGPDVLLVRSEDQNGFYPVTNGSVHVVEKGRTFCCHYSRCPTVTISLVDADKAEKRFPQAPPEFHKKGDRVLLFEDGPNVTLISPQRNISFSLGDGRVADFRFPFQSVWQSEREYGLWWAGEPCRGRIDDVRKRIVSAKVDAESALEYVRKRFAPEIASVVFSGDSTCAKLSVSLDGVERFPQFGKAVLTVEKDRYGMRLLALSLLPDVGGGLSHQYLFDRSGHLIWHMARDGSKRNKDGAFDGPDGFSLFELASNGSIRRAFFGNVLPLLIVTERTFFFTGDGELVRQFLSDYVAASRHGEKNE